MSNSVDYSKLSKEEKLVFIERHYINGDISISELARMGKTYPNKIRRDMIEAGIEIKSRSEVQKNLLASGKVEHPTRGKKHNEDTKQKIGNAIMELWENLPPEERERRSQISKERWDSLTEEQKTVFNNAKFDAIRKAAKEGSKLEKFLHEELIGDNHIVLYHQKHTLGHDKLELDILLPAHKIAIEVDGISHVEAVWGQKTFERNQKADNLKNGLLLRHGYKVIRLVCTKRLSKSLKDKMWKELKETVDAMVAGTIKENIITIGDE